MNKENFYKHLGISFYLSNLDAPEYLYEAKRKGIDNIFVSLHIPEEVDRPDFVEKVNKLLALLNQLKFSKIMCDVSPIGFKKLGCTPSDVSFFTERNVYCLRMDYGFSPEEMKRISSRILISINGSTVDRKQLGTLKDLGITNKIIACHNFYPLPGTALSEKELARYDVLLKEYGIKSIASYIPGNRKKRAPLFEGIPTLEKHRYLSIYNALNELKNDFNHDVIYISDPDCDFEALESSANFDEEIILDVQIYEGCEKFFLNKSEFTTRFGASLIRLSGTRIMAMSESGSSESSIGVIEPIKNKVAAGDIVVANKDSLRYMGEVGIVIGPIEEEYFKFFNVIGKAKIDYDKEYELTVNRHIKLNYK